MSQPPDEGPSFDPKTWLKPAGEAGSETPTPPVSSPAHDPGSTSFNPKAWTTGVNPIPRPDRVKEPEPPPPRARRIPAALIGGGAAVVVLAALGGGYLAWRVSAHRDAPPTDKGVAPAVAAAASEDFSGGTGVRRSLVIGGPDQLPAAMTSAGVDAAQAAQVAAAASGVLGSAQGSLHLTLVLNPAGQAMSVVTLEARRDDNTGVIVRRDRAGGFQAAAAAADLTSGVKVVRSEMDANSFYSSAVAAGVPDVLITPFAQAFTYDFDFAREIKPGDIFEAAFEQKTDSRGAPVSVGNLLFVSLETQAKSAALYRFQPPGSDAGWYDGNGRSVVRALMRTPVEGARISSGFGMRLHPVLGFEKMHNGVDFAAPVGVPIYAAGDGVVQFAGPKGPNGNFVQILHDNGWQTLYLHMSAFGPGMTAGARVRQGDLVGKVGATGVDRSGHSTVTGPHLHYEVHIDGKPVDPLSVQTSTEAGHALGGDVLRAFLKERDRIDALRAAQSG